MQVPNLASIVKGFNALDDWKAFRLCCPSVALPDVLAVVKYIEN